MKTITQALLSAPLLFAALIAGCARHDHAPAVPSGLAPATSEGDRFDVVVPANTIIKIVPGPGSEAAPTAYRYDVIVGDRVVHTGRRTAKEGTLTLPPTTAERNYLYVDGVEDTAASKPRLTWKSFGAGVWRLRIQDPQASRRGADLVLTVLFAKPDKYAGTGAAASPAVRGSASASPRASSATAPAAAGWTPASQSVQIGDARVQLLSAAVTRVPLVNTRGEASESDKPYLVLTFSVENASPTKVIQFKNWESYHFPVDREVVEDENGNTYKLASFGPLKQPAGRDQPGPIRPGQALTDVLAFDAPAAGVKYVQVELPARNLGGTGSFRFQIPADMIKF